jgi:hypothetical protein
MAHRVDGVSGREATTNHCKGKDTMALDSGNQISLKIPADQLQDILATQKHLIDLCRPYLVDLDAEGRKALAKMGTRTVEFVGKALQYAREHPEFQPSYFDLDEFACDYDAVDTLQSLLRPLTQLVDMLSDSQVLSGSEAYAAALAYYKSVKAAAKRGLPGAALIADDLGRQFMGRGRSPAPAPVPEPAPAPVKTVPPSSAA